MAKKSKGGVQFSKIIKHPEKRKIIKWLSDGMGVREVERRLKEKYPNDKSFQITAPTLQKFRKQYLKIEGEVLKEIKHMRDEGGVSKAEDLTEKEIHQLPAYKKKLLEAAEFHVDLQKEISELVVLSKGRLEVMYNKVMSEEGLSTNQEKNLQNWFKLSLEMLDKHAKYVEKIGEKTGETNINITLIEDQVGIIKEAIKEIIMELEPGLAMKFIDKINGKMKELTFKREESSFEEIKNETKMLSNVAEVQDAIEEFSND